MSDSNQSIEVQRASLNKIYKANNKHWRTLIEQYLFRHEFYFDFVERKSNLSTSIFHYKHLKYDASVRINGCELLIQTPDGTIEYSYLNLREINDIIVNMINLLKERVTDGIQELN